MNSKDLITIASNLKAGENINEMNNFINCYFRYKETVPFSDKLNNFINDWFEEHKEIFVFTEVDDFDASDIVGTFQQHQNHFNETGKINIWTGCSEGTIFGDPIINHKFRAWHDYTHIINGFGYSQTEEAIVSDIQRSQLPKNWIFEDKLVHAEIVGQAHFNFINGAFVNNQRLFTIQYLQNPTFAIRNIDFKTI